MKIRYLIASLKLAYILISFDHWQYMKKVKNCSVVRVKSRKQPISPEPYNEKVDCKDLTLSGAGKGLGKEKK